jgi:hypothetical protein
MRHAVTIALLLASCGPRCDKCPFNVADAPPDAEPPCQPLTQTGCGFGKKCTWKFDSADSGHVGCAPNGFNSVGASCIRNPPRPTGYDDCVQGSYCIGAAVGGSGTCAAICDLSGGAPACSAPKTCVAQSPIFGQPPEAGLCM